MELHRKAVVVRTSSKRDIADVRENLSSLAARGRIGAVVPFPDESAGPEGVMGLEPAESAGEIAGANVAPVSLANPFGESVDAPFR